MLIYNGLMLILEIAIGIIVGFFGLLFIAHLLENWKELLKLIGWLIILVVILVSIYFLPR